MPTQDEYDDDEFDTDEAGKAESDLVKDLRKQLRVANKKVIDLEAAQAEQAKGLRERTVKDVLAAKGVREGIAKFIPESVKDEEGVNAWLEENAEDLGITLGEADDSDNEPDPELESSARVQKLTQRQTKNVGLAATLKEIENSSDEEFEAVLEKARSKFL